MNSAGAHDEDLMLADDDIDFQNVIGNDFADVITPKSKKTKKKEAVSPSTPSSSEKGLSAREKYLMKKKVKAQQKRKDLEVKEESRVAKRMKTVVTEQPQTEQKLVIESVVDKQASAQLDKWPFHSFTEQYKIDLMNASWEIRHGAALGLKSVLQYHAKSAGKTIHVTEDERTIQNEVWLEDCCIRLLCIFALDRFADFVSDQVVCPVREACAQTLGMLLHHVKSEIVKQAVKSLLILVQHQEHWEVRYGGLLGLKYAIAIRQDVY